MSLSEVAQSLCKICHSCPWWKLSIYTTPVQSGLWAYWSEPSQTGALMLQNGTKQDKSTWIPQTRRSEICSQPRPDKYMKLSINTVKTSLNQTGRVQSEPVSTGYLPSISPPGAEIFDMQRWVVPMTSLWLALSLERGRKRRSRRDFKTKRWREFKPEVFKLWGVQERWREIWGER